MPKVVFVSNSSLSMYFFRKGIIAYLVDHQYDVHIIAPRDYKTEELKQLGGTFHELNFQTKNTNPFQDFLLLLRLFQLYRTLKPDIIFHYTIKPNIYGTLAAKICRIKSIAVITGLGYAFLTENWINKLVQAMYRFSLRYAFQIWFLNKDDQELFIQRKIVPISKTFILPGEGVNTSEFVPSHKTNPGRIFLMIARVLWDKGVLEYVEAAKIIKQEFPDTQFQLLGATDVDNPSAVPGSLVAEWNNKGFIEYLGVSSSVQNEIAKANCIVLPSYREGISKVLMEAASMAKPLIATNVTGCRELIEEGVNGYLCEVKSVESLVEKIKKIIQLSDSAIREMGENGRNKMIREFDEQNVIGIYLRYIKS